MSRWGARQWRTLALLCASQFMLVLDTSIVSVALPAVQDDLGLSQGNLQWVVSVYTLVFGGFLLLGGRAGDHFGRRKIFAGGLALFTLASLLGGLAPSAGVLVAARALQGLGAAAVTPAALSLLLAAFPDGPGRARALGVWGGALSLGLCAGVLLGGVLTDAFGWRWVMLVNVPLGASAAVLAPLLIREEPRRASPGRLDVAGAASATLGLFALVYGLSRVGGDAPALWTAALPFGLALASLSVFVFVEARSPSPLVPLGVFRRGPFVSANVLALLLSGTAAPMFFLVTLYMQQVLGYSALGAGLAWLPYGVAGIVASEVSGGLVARFGLRPALAGGFAVLAAGLALLSGGVSADGTFLVGVLPGTLLASLGLAPAFLAVTAAATAGAEDSEQGIASGILNTAQQVGISLGLAVLAAVSAYGADVAAPAAPEEALAAGFRYALATGCGLALLGAVASLLAVRGGAALGDEHHRYPAAASAVPSFCPRPARARHVPGGNPQPEPGTEPSRERRE